MRWFKHFVDASNDEFIADMEDEFGLPGYARWFKLLEIIAAQMDESGRHSASYPEKKWCRKLQCKPKVLGRFLECTDNAGKTNSKRSGNILEISCPKLLELRDNYTKNLQASNKGTGKKVSLEVEVEEEVHKPKTLVFVPPTVEEVRQYAKEKGYDIDAEYFWAHHDTRDWMLKTGKMKKWKSAVTTWSKNNFDNKKKAPNSNGQHGYLG